MKNIIIHFGINKTASSSIQNTLKHNSSLLLKSGFNFPLFSYRSNVGSPNHSFALSSLFLKKPENSLYNIKNTCSKDLLDQDIERYKEQLTKALTENNTLILSAESLCTFNMHSWRKLIRFIKHNAPASHITLIGFTRRHEDFAVSAIQQIMKVGRFTFATKKNIFLKTASALYQKKLGNLRLIKNIDNVSVFAFEEAKLHKNGPVGFFLEKIGVDEDLQQKINFIRCNDSMPTECVLFLDKLNSKYPSIINKKSNKTRPRFLHHDIPGAKFALDRDYVERITTTTATDKIWLYDNFKIDYRTNNALAEWTAESDLWKKTTLTELAKRVIRSGALVDIYIELLVEQKADSYNYDADTVSRINKTLTHLKPLQNRDSILLYWICRFYWILKW